MRVLFWSELFSPAIGGAERLALRLLPALRERGHELAVITQHAVGEAPNVAQLGDVPIHRIGFTAGLRTRQVDLLVTARRQIRALRREFRPDLVHHWLPGPSLALEYETAAVHPAPRLLTTHNSPAQLWPAQDTSALAPATGGTLDRWLTEAAWVTTCAPAHLHDLRARLPTLTARSSSIANALEPPIGAARPLPWAPASLLYLGRLVPLKGVDLALDAFARATTSHPAVRLTIAGDGPERASLERRAAALGLAERVDFLGWVEPSRVDSVINSATILLMPSHVEGLPLVALEAAQRGRPVVGTTIPGLMEIIVDGATGLLTPAGDSAAFARAIMTLLDQPDLATRLGQAARVRVTSTYSWDRFVDAYHALYQRLGGVAG